MRGDRILESIHNNLQNTVWLTGKLGFNKPYGIFYIVFLNFLW